MSVAVRRAGVAPGVAETARRAGVLAPSLLAALSLSCADTVQGLGEGRDPIATVRGRLPPGLVASASAGASLRAGLLWAGVPVFVPYCHDNGPNPREPGRVVTSSVATKGCRSPFEVVPERMGPSVAIDLSSERFEIPLMQLPEVEVMIGPPEARVAYASLVVFEERDDDGILDLVRGCRRDGMDRRRRVTERVLASSFASLEQTQVRIAYVEGTFDAGSYFYPRNPACNTLPPAGFSVWTVGPLLGEAGACRVDGIGTEIQLEAVGPKETPALACQAQDRESFSRPPREQAPGQGFLVECDGEGAMVVADATCPCPEVRRYALTGCYDEVECDDLDWDLRGSPPAWWTCGGATGP